MYTPPRIDGRLMSAAPFVRGGFIADVGTDHAYLPVWLMLHGKILGAVASDIKRGPLARAAMTVEKYGLSEKITLKLADGLSGLEEFSPRDIVIFGMGGEMIISILEAAAWVMDSGIRLILQPMTRRDTLREYLLERGFNIIDEVMSESDGRIYQTICAEYDGVGRAGKYSPAELLLGARSMERGGELVLRYAAQLIRIYKTRIEGKIKTEAGTADEETVLRSLEEFIAAAGFMDK